MRLGRAAAYAVFAVVYIAEHYKGAALQGRDIAQSCGMPPGRLLKLLQQLVRGRVLLSERGPSGGFRLRRPPADITLLDIVEVIDGPIDGDLLLRDGIVASNRSKSAVEKACTQVAEFARSRLREVSILDLMS